MLQNACPHAKTGPPMRNWKTLLQNESKIPRFDEAAGHSFTYKYTQPDEYRFCQDSVIFPMFVAEQLKSREIGPEFRALDIGSGCGVIGLELAHYVPTIQLFDFLEIQEHFKPYFEENLKTVGRNEDQFRFINGNYRDLCNENSRATYDLIVSNPPYFLPGEGKLSPSELRNRCRFFLDSDLETLMLAIANSLKPNGTAYVLTKTGKLHGRNALREIRLHLIGRGAVELVADIRGTGVLKITR